MHDAYDDFILLRNNHTNGKLLTMRQPRRLCACPHSPMANMIPRDSNSMVMLGKKKYKHQFPY